SSLVVCYVYSQSFSPSLVDLDGFQFAALDLMQHGLASHAEGLGNVGQPQPALGNLGGQPVTHGLVDADPPRGSRGELLAGEEPVGQPPVDRDLPNTQEALGLGNVDHEDILLVSTDRLVFRLLGGGPP